MSSIPSLSLQSIHTRAQTPSPRSVSAPAPICFAVVYILVIFVRPIISTSTYCLNIIYDMSHVTSIDGFMPSQSTCRCTRLLLMLLFCYVTNKFFIFFFFFFFFFFFYQTDLHEICRIASPLAADNDVKLLFRSLEGRCQGNKFCGQNRPPSLTL